MYLSIRDAILHQLGESMGEKENLLAGLNFLNLNALEMERWERLSSEGTSEKSIYSTHQREICLLSNWTKTELRYQPS